MRIGVFGGTFDPPHTGHLILAEYALTGLQLDTVLFVPAYRSPFKVEQHMTSAAMRCEMVELAISGNPRFALEPFEAMQKGVSFSIDTMRHLRAAYPGDSLHLIMGADAFNDFPEWKDPAEIASIATLSVGCRHGFALDLRAHPYAARAERFTMPEIQISSTEIRRRRAEGLSIRYLVPAAVAAYIEAQGLYRGQLKIEN